MARAAPPLPAETRLGGGHPAGGFGFDDKWLGGGRRPLKWRETNARFTGPTVTQLQAAFIAKWAEATGRLLTGEHFLPFDDVPATTANGAAGKTEAALIYSPPLTGSTTAERLLALSIASPRRRLYIANAYFIPDADFVQLLIAAARRGVDVRILTNGNQSDVKTTLLAAACSSVRRLSSQACCRATAGIELTVDDAILHRKEEAQYRRHREIRQAIRLADEDLSEDMATGILTSGQCE